MINTSGSSRKGRVCRCSLATAVEMMPISATPWVMAWTMRRLGSSWISSAMAG
ncbi:hypothetical protein D9M71_786590 [compost metagenome]